MSIPARDGPPPYRFVHLQLHVGLEAEEFVRPGGGELFGAVCEEEEVAEEESPQLPAAFGFVKPAAVQQLARPEAVRQRVEDQVLEDSASSSWKRSAAVLQQQLSSAGAALPRWAPHTGCEPAATPACPSSPSLGPPR